MFHRTTEIAELLNPCLIVILFILLLPVAALAGEVTLEWDPISPVPDGYKLFQRSEGQSYDYNNPVYSGSDTSYTVTGLEAGRSYYFVVRAFDSGCESDDSNEVSFVAESGGESKDDTIPGTQPGGGPEGGSSDGDSGSDQDSAPGPGGDSGDPLTTGPISNSAPFAPVPVSPNLTDNASLTPVLIAGPFDDPDQDGHAQSRWQVSTVSDFSDLVLDRVCFNQLKEFFLADMTLDPETTYYWRVCYTDSAGRTSGWSEPAVFTTIDAVAAGDSNGNGLPDDQETRADSDLDGDGQNDLFQSDMLVVHTASGEGMVGVKCNSPDVQVVGLKSLKPEEVAGEDIIPANMTFGLISFKLLLAEGVTTATVTVYFSQQLQPGGQWYKYGIENGWEAYDFAMFGADGRSVTLVLEDGGMGDEDGVRNGVIVDPSGMGFGDDYNLSLEQSGTTGCFISTGFCRKRQAGVVAVRVVCLLLFLVFLGAGVVKSRFYGDYHKYFPVDE